MITLQTSPKQSVTILGQVSPTISVTSAPTQTVIMKAAAPRGPEGPQGPVGPPGPVGNVDLDAPDWTLIFENALI